MMKNSMLLRIAFQKLSIYRDLRLGVVLQAVFPLVYAVIVQRLGRARWDDVAKHYFETHPPNHFELNMNGVHFPDHLHEYAAAAHDLQDAMKERLQRAHFTEGALLSDHETLVRLLR